MSRSVTASTTEDRLNLAHLKNELPRRLELRATRGSSNGA